MAYPYDQNFLPPLDTLGMMEAEFAPPPEEPVVPQWGTPISPVPVEPEPTLEQPPPAPPPAPLTTQDTLPPAEPVQPQAPQSFAPAEFDVDVVSGGDMAPVPPQPEQPQAPVSLPSADMGEISETLEAQRLVASPETFAVEKADAERERAQFKLEEEQEALARDREEAARNDLERQDTLQRLERQRVEWRQDAKALSEKKVDPDRWWNSRSTGQKIAAIISAAIGGMLNPGGRNGMLEMMQGAIDADINAQMADMQHQRNLLGEQKSLLAEEYARTGDIYRAKETVRAANYERVIQQIQMDAAKYDPRGTAARARAETVFQLRHAQAEAAAKADKEMFERGVQATELTLKARADQRAQQKHQRDMAPKPGARVLPPEYFKALYGVDVPVPMSEGSFKSYLANKKSVQTLDGKPETPSEEKAALELEHLKRSDVIIDPGSQKPLGRPISARPEDRRATSEKIEAHAVLRDRVGRLMDFIAKKPTEQKLLSRWKSENTARVETLREQAAQTYAKIVDPVGAVSDKTVDAAKNVLPDIEGWTERKHPRAVYEALVKNADEAIELHAKGAIDGYEPGRLTKQYLARDRQLFAPRPDSPDSPPPAEGSVREAEEGGFESEIVYLEDGTIARRYANGSMVVLSGPGGQFFNPKSLRPGEALPR